MEGTVFIGVIVPSNFYYLDFRCRPKKIKVFLQPYAGKKTAKSIYYQKIRPIFQAAGVEEDCIGENVTFDV